MSDARRALEGDNADRQAAAEGVAEAIAAADAELSWRTPAAEDLLPVLGAYDDGIRTNIGLRQLPRFPREQALYAVPELDPSAAAVAIEDREMRDWWRSLPTRERKEMLDHIKDAPDQHQRLAIALLRAPAAAS